MILQKYTYLIGGGLLGAVLLFAPAAYAFDAAGLKSTTQSLEDAFERLPPNSSKRLELLEKIEANHKTLEEIERRKTAEKLQNIQTQKAANPIVERQAQVLEATQKFLPEEIAHMRGSALAVNTEDAQIFREKSLKDEAFTQQVDAINKQIATQQEVLRKLFAQRAEIISAYNQDIKNFAETKDLPFKPIAAPIAPNAPPIMGAAVPKPPVSNNKGRVEFKSGGGVNTEALIQDFRAH